MRGLRASNKSLSNEIRRWQTLYDEAEERLDVALELKAGKGTYKVPEISSSKAKVSESVAHLIGSDWHVEEKVDPSTVGGRNEFTLPIASSRVEAFFENGIKLVNIQRHGTDIDTIVLGLLGDHITGYIHDELLEENYLSPTQALLWLHPRVTAGIKKLRAQCKKLIIVCNYGNHGRTTLKRRVASAYKNSYEWMFYHILKLSFEDPAIEFIIPNGYHNFMRTYGRTIRFHHGDAIRYQGGVGGLYIPTNKAIGQWNKGERAYLDVFGHWHQFRDGGSFISNGSLIGENAFSVEIKADPEPPQQAFFLIEKNYGKTVCAPIMLK